MGVERKQIDWLDPVGLQIRGLLLNTINNGAAIASGYGIGGGDAHEVTALNTAITAVANNAHVTPAVRQLSGPDLYAGTPTTRGVLSDHAGAAVDLATVTITDCPLINTQNGQDYILNKVRIRDSIKHDAINDNDGNEIWGFLVDDDTALTGSPTLVFAHGDPDGSYSKIDIKTTTWWLTEAATWGNGPGAGNYSIEIICNESVEFRDRPYGHNLREITNFFDVAFEGAKLPVLIFTNATGGGTYCDFRSEAAAAGAVISTVTLPGDTIDITGCGLVVANFKVGARIGLHDPLGGPADTATQILANVAGILTVTPVGAPWVGVTATVDCGITQWNITDPLFTTETNAGDKSRIEGMINGTHYVVMRKPQYSSTAGTIDIENGTDVDSDFAAGPFESTGDLYIQWIDLAYANPIARFELEDVDEAYFVIHFK